MNNFNCSPNRAKTKTLVRHIGVLTTLAILAGCSSGSDSPDPLSNPSASNQTNTAISEVSQTSSSDAITQSATNTNLTTILGTGNLLPVLFDTQTDLDLAYAQAGVDLIERLNSAFILPADIDVIFADCGVANAFYIGPIAEETGADGPDVGENDTDDSDAETDSPDQSIESENLNQLVISDGGSVVMCHELTQLFSNFYSDKDQAVSASIFVLMHELGHALVNQLSLPVLGIEESYVDGMAAVFLGEAGMSEGSVLAGWFFGSQSETPFFDSHRAGPQRLGDLACWGIGADESLAANPVIDNISQQLIIGGRDCVREYEQQRTGLSRVLSPHLNVDLQDIFDG